MPTVTTKKNKESFQWYDRAIMFCLYGLVILVPVVFSPWFHTVFSMPKLLVLRLITLIIIVLWGCKIFVEEKFSYRKNTLNIAIIAYALVSIITTIFSTAFYTSLYGAEGRFLGIFTVLNFLFLPLVVLHFFDKKNLKNLIVVSILTSSVLAIYGLLQYFGIGQDGFHWSQNPADRVFGTVGHANHFGAYLGMNILAGFFIFLMHLSEKRSVLINKNITQSHAVLKGLKKNKIGIKILQWFLVPGIFLQMGVLFLTGSRGAIFSVFLSFAVTFIYICYRHREKFQKFFKKNTRYILGGALLIVLAFIIAWSNIRQISLIQRTIGTLQFMQEGNTPDRVSWWLSTLEMIKDKPLLGHGLSTYRDIYNQYRRADYKVPGPGDMQNLITPEAAHNEYLNIAATQGFSGLFAFLAILFLSLWKMNKLLFSVSTREEFYLALAVKGALMVYLVQIFVSFGVITTITVFFIFIGLGVVIVGTDQEKQTVICKGFIKYLVAIIVLGGVCSGAYFTFLEGRADYSYKQAEVAAAAGQLENAIENYQRALLDKPFEYAYFQAFADFALKSASITALKDDVQVKFLKLSVMNYQSAIKINSHHPSTFYNLGLAELKLYMIMGNEAYYNAASANLKKSVELAVNNPLYAEQVENVLSRCQKSGYCKEVFDTPATNAKK